MTINIVEDTLSGYGLRVLHGISFQYPIEVAEMMALVPAECKELATYYPVIERDMKIFHMYAAWQVREMVDFSKMNATATQKGKGVARYAPTGSIETIPLRYGVMWYINTRAGETMSLAIELAAAMYLDKTGRWPTAVWMKKKPKTAPDAYVVIMNHDDKPKDARECEQYTLALEEGAWVPEKFIVVGIPRTEWDAKWKDGKYE